MPKALATEKNKALKEATKKAATKGITKPKHSASPFDAASLGQLTGQGLDSNQRRVIESKHVGKVSGATHTHRMEKTMSDTAPQVSEAQAMKEEAAKAKIAAKEAKLKAAKEKKAAAEKAKQEKAELAAKKKAEAEAARAAKAAEREAAKAAQGEKAPRERTYTGSMLSLADRVATGVYTKGKNGQLRSNDELAVALEVVPAKQMVGLLLAILGLAENPYPHLNYGQQSMNLRNKLRGSIKSGAKIGEGEDAPVINLERVKSFVADLVVKEAEPATA